MGGNNSKPSGDKFHIALFVIGFMITAIYAYTRKGDPEKPTAFVKENLTTSALGTEKTKPKIKRKQQKRLSDFVARVENISETTIEVLDEDDSTIFVPKPSFPLQENSFVRIISDTIPVYTIVPDSECSNGKCWVVIDEIYPNYTKVSRYDPQNGTITQLCIKSPDFPIKVNSDVLMEQKMVVEYEIVQAYP